MQVKVKNRMMKKVYVEGGINNIRVGMLQICLSDTVTEKIDGTNIIKKNNPVTLYDTSGPYGDSSFKPDYTVGLPCMREPWYSRRKDLVCQPTNNESAIRKTLFHAKKGKHITQMYYAKKRVISPEMEYVAIRENQQTEALGLKSYITPDFVRKEIAAGRAVIPANINHVEVEPMIIGNRFFVKINSNIRLKKFFSKDDCERVRQNCIFGVDTLMDISEERLPTLSRDYLIRNTPIPVGTPPIYQALANAEGSIENLSWDIYRDTLVEQLEQGVDFISVHAAMKRKYVKMATHRLAGITSHAGMIMSEWMRIHKEENFLNTHFREICEIAGAYDAVVSLGSGLRPGSIYDANDYAQLAELAEMRALIETAWKQYIQIMGEGSGHMPINKIESYMKEHRYICKGIPLFSPSMLTSDIATGHEHIAAAIGCAQVACHGASLIGGIKNQINIKNTKQMQTDILSYKIAAHSADLAKGHPGAQVRDNAFSKARRENRYNDCEKLSLSL